MSNTIWLIFVLIPQPVFAHDGSDHGNMLEVWVSGIGIVLIILLTIYQIWWKQRDIDFTEDNNFDSFIDES